MMSEWEWTWTLREGGVGHMSWALVNEWCFPFFLWKKMSVEVRKFLGTLQTLKLLNDDEFNSDYSQLPINCPKGNPQIHFQSWLGTPDVGHIYGIVYGLVNWRKKKKLSCRSSWTPVFPLLPRVLLHGSRSSGGGNFIEHFTLNLAMFILNIFIWCD